MIPPRRDDPCFIPTYVGTSSGIALSRAALTLVSLLPVPLSGTQLSTFNNFSGADERIRTSDPCFTKALLYQLSYIGTSFKNSSRGPRPA